MARLKVVFSGVANYPRRTFDWLQTSLPGKILLILLVTSLVFRWFYYIDKYSVNLLFYDMWTFYEPFFNGNHNIIKLFTWQHGPHRQGIGFLLTWCIDAFSHWNTRWICFAIGIIIFCTSLIYLRLKKHLFNELNYFDVIIVFIVLTPAQYGLFANTPNISHGAAPAILLSLLCLSWTMGNVFLRYASVSLVNFLLIYSGFGFLMGLITPLILLMDGWHHRKGSGRTRVVITCALILSIVSFLGFFIDYRFNATANPSFKFPHDQPVEYLEFMVTMMATALSGRSLVGAVGLGLCFLVGIFHLKKLISPDSSSQQYLISKIIVTLMAFSFLFMVSTAIGRVSIGMEGAKASRYTPYVLPSIFALYLHVCSLKKDTYKLLTPILLIFFLVQTTFIHFEVGMMKNFRNSKVAWKEIYLETGSMEEVLGKTRYGIHEGEEPEREWLRNRLKYLERNRLNLFLDKEEQF